VARQPLKLVPENSGRRHTLGFSAQRHYGAVPAGPSWGDR